MALINKARLHQYLKLEYNVLFCGLHGTGKTTIIKEVFEEAGLTYKYFSASTMDPFVDLVGIPKIIQKNGRDTLELIRPDFIDNVDALIFDELNRAPDKVLNAIMEIIQFKSINGVKLPKLKVIWAAINPEDEDDTYSVNHLDPAQIDRFQVYLKVPYKIDEDYFNLKYPNTAPIFIQWWKDLPIDIQKTVSPRRVDYAADAYSKGCRLEDFLPIESNVKQLRDSLKSLPYHELIKGILTEEAAILFIKDINNSTKLLDLVKANDAIAIDFFVKYGKQLPRELVAPIAEFVNARKLGFEVVTSIEELINKLPDDKGNQGTGALINNIQLNLLYQNGGNLENDLRALGSTQHNLVMKLSNRCCDILINCQGATLERIFWGIEGKSNNKPTNFQEIVILLAKIGGFFTAKQKSYINNKLYSRGIVKDMNFL